jgi:hypothetical protein
MEFANQEKIVKTARSIVQTQPVEMEFVSLLVEKMHPIVLSIAVLLVETKFVNQEKIHQIAALIVMKLITKRNATTMMSIGMIAMDKEQIRPKNAEIQDGRMNTGALEIGSRENM